MEMLIVVTLLAALAGIAVPSLSSGDDRRLDVAATEVRDALRFARAEALRRGKPTLLDAETSPGKVKVMMLSAFGCASYSSSNVAIDPRTKSAFAVDVAGGAFTSGVGVTPRFMAGGAAYAGLVFDANGVPTEVCQVTGSTSKGAPTAGSDVLLTLGNRQTSVSVDVATGRVSLP